MIRLHRSPRARAPGALAALLLCVLASTTALAQESRDPDRFFFDQSLGDFAEELAAAKAQGKQGVLLMFEIEGCPYCRRMRAEALSRPEIQDFYKKRFLIFAVDIESSQEIADFAGHARSQKDFAVADNGVRATPTFIFFDLDGKPIAKYTGATADAAEFLWLGEYVAAGRYRDTPFPDYKRERQAMAGPGGRG